MVETSVETRTVDRSKSHTVRGCLQNTLDRVQIGLETTEIRVKTETQVSILCRWGQAPSSANVAEALRLYGAGEGTTDLLIVAFERRSWGLRTEL